jgi:putative tryptophan/tyrosine transport system substrate-binding protein
MTRRELMALFGGAAVMWPLAASAQTETPVIGFLSSGSPAAYQPFLAAFRAGLSETGFVEGKNVATEYRWAEGRYDRLAEFAAELVRRRVAVIVASGGAVRAIAAKAATSTIPIVFSSGGDAVRLGFAASLNRPGGNATGVNLVTNAPVVKRLELAHELVPSARAIAVLVNPSNGNIDVDMRDAEVLARKRGLAIVFLRAENPRDLDGVFSSLTDRRADALVMTSDAFFTTERERILALAARYAIPMICDFPEMVAAGGLLSYGPSLTEAYHQVGLYAGRIPKGANPGDMPVVQPTKFELAINLRTAKALRLEIPASILARADEVIE